jgi:hypothetical protein
LSGTAPQPLTLCLRGRESRGGGHGSVRKPAEENGVQGETATRLSPRTRPLLPNAPDRDEPSPASLPGGPEAPVRYIAAFVSPSPPSGACRVGIPGLLAGDVGRERRQPSTKARSRGRLPPAARPSLFGRVWSFLWGSRVSVLNFTNKKR